MISKEDLIGDFQIQGKNQNQEANSYQGTLSIQLDSMDRILATWNISDGSVQQGVGFFHGNILVIQFEYGDFMEFKGVVVYKCLNANILEGFWSEEVADPKYMGFENAFRIQDTLQN